MSKLRVQIVTRKQADLAIDHIVNTVYFDDFNVPGGGGTNHQAVANDVRDQFKARGLMPNDYGVETRVYDMADAEPRPVKAYGQWSQGAITNLGVGVREVALCLSYYSERNLKRFRGRIYIGPWPRESMGERPQADVIGSVRALATSLSAIGGAGMDWQLYSPTRLAYSKVTNGWVDNEWDTIRSRGMKATSRVTFATGE